MAVFNRENGLAFGSKTPVSILQEILQKKGLIPQYELIYNGVGTQDPLFKFRVSAEGETAIGDGKSKKEAKHDAAATLLNRLLSKKEESTEEKTKEDVDIASPYTGALKTNFVGMLDDICYINKIPPANYVLVTEDGPPHARVFTMKCVVGSISTIDKGRTKKQAKHLVAKEMIERVGRLLKDRFVPSSENEEEEIVSDQEKIRSGTFNHDLSHKVKDLHNVFHTRKDERPLPPVFQQLPEKPESYYESMEKPVEFLEEIVEALEGVVVKNYITKADFESSLKQLVYQFEEEFRIDCEDDENEHFGERYYSSENNTTECLSTENLISDNREEKDSLKNSAYFDFILPDFLSDDEDGNSGEVVAKEDEEVSETVVVDRVQEVNNKNLVADREVESKNSRVSEDCPFFSIVKVEVPLGRWAFVGRGKSVEESLEETARDAIIFLRTLAIPPPENVA